MSIGVGFVLLLNVALTSATEELTQGTTMAGNPFGLKIHPEQCTSVEGKAAVRCCSDSVDKVPSAKYGCHPLETRASAEAICQKKGYRLCTQPEIAAGRANYMGCGFDMKRVWTSTACDRRLQTGPATDSMAKEKINKYEEASDGLSIYTREAAPWAHVQATILGPRPLFTEPVVVTSIWV